MNIYLNPNNPRIIRDDKFKKLCQSIKEFPKMLELRPIIVDDKGMILGGNMRFRALQELGWEIKDEWVKKANDLTEEEKKRFIIEDNIPFGEWDWDKLADEWDAQDLGEWGIDLPTGWGIEDVVTEDGNKPKDDMHAIVIVAYEDLNDLDKLTSLYELECVDITEDIKDQISTQRKVYVFKK